MKAKVSRSSRVKVRFALFCDYALISADQKLSILGEFNQIFSFDESPTLNKAFLVASFQGPEGGRSDIQVTLGDEKGDNKLFERTFEINYGPQGIANLLIEFGGLKFPGFGRYLAKFTDQSELLAEVEIRVVKVKQNNAAQA